MLVDDQVVGPPEVKGNEESRNCLFACLLVCLLVCLFVCVFCLFVGLLFCLFACFFLLLLMFLVFLSFFCLLSLFYFVWESVSLHDMNSQQFLTLHPGRLTWNIIMEVWFRSFSFLNGWFLGSMLIFQGVLLFCYFAPCPSNSSTHRMDLHFLLAGHLQQRFQFLGSYWWDEGQPGQWFTQIFREGSIDLWSGCGLDIARVCL